LARVKFQSVIIFINISINITLLLLLQSPHGARASTAISQMRPNALPYFIQEDYGVM
jgi:preprotein translocase subunit SecG